MPLKQKKTLEKDIIIFFFHFFFIGFFLMLKIVFHLYEHMYFKAIYIFDNNS